MTLSRNGSLEQLIELRNAIFKTISNLEMNLVAEKKKAAEFDFFRNDKSFDKDAMDLQIQRSLGNIKSIQQVLDTEHIKLAETNKQISSLTGIINSHQTHLCLIGTVPHSWQTLSRHNSGAFSHRKCTICGTDEKVGY